MFTVVDFENDGGVALVATKWLECHENELSTYWPPTKSSTLLTKFIKTQQEPDKNNWGKFSCRQLYSTGKIDYIKISLFSQN